jgi:5-(carboxyamino)imidazole ribonucleotide synthase
MTVLKPGSTIGIIGGGQLGRMQAMAAAQLGYRCHIYAPETDSVAADVAATFTCATYEDRAALERFASSVDVVTYEFENLPVDALRPLEALALVRPGLRPLEIAQDRLAEKRFVADLGGRTAPWAPVDCAASLADAIARIGAPAILKTTRFGYDGKGQARIADPAEAEGAWAAIGNRPAILEGFVHFDQEFSVILARGGDGEVRFWDCPANVHKHGILDTSSVPASGAIAAQTEEARTLARIVADTLDYVGVLTLEFFAAAEGPVFNEMAPRVHNSGHWTIEGALTSQFENHVRAVCGLPLGDTALVGRKVTMTNLIGDDVDAWRDLLADPTAHLHLYGKDEARPGRKMGHVTRLEI